MGRHILCGVGLLAPVVASPASLHADEVCECPCQTAQPQGPGTATLVIKPSTEAFEKNRAGFAAYRQRQFAAARASYAAALVADPNFLAPRLNIACAFTQEERFADAVAAAGELAQRGFVPWGREIEQAADLAPLRIRAEFQTLKASLAAAGRTWGAALFDGPSSFVFVARTAPPVTLVGTGVLVLAPSQEVFAYLPNSGGYRQLTNEDGRVLAAARSPNGRELIYVRGSKLTRVTGQPDRLRGLTVRRLALADMTLGPPVPVPGDVERLGLGFSQDGGVHVTVASADASPSRWMLENAALADAGFSKAPRDLVVLTPAGVTSGARLAVHHPDGRCRYVAADVRSEARGTQQIMISAGRRRFALLAPDGAGLHGLPFVTRASVDDGRGDPSRSRSPAR
jgi:hypothetical protein